jgi:putative ABC transport system permease protein
MGVAMLEQRGSRPHQVRHGGVFKARGGDLLMRMLMAIKIAKRALGRNLMRSVLTMLGVIIGVGAVIAMVAIGQGAHASIRAKIASLGANSLIILPGSTTQSGVRLGWGGRATLRPADVKAIQQECPAIAYVTPSVRTVAQVVYANQNWATSIQGTGIEYPDVREWPLVSGSWFTQQDVDAAGKVAVLGQTVAEWLFGSIDPIGQVIQMKNMPFRVVGLLTAKGQSTQGQDQDDVMFIPYTTAQKKLIGITHIHSILASAVSNEMMTEAMEQITALLRQRHRLMPWQDNDFSIQPLADVAAAEEESSRTMTLLLGSIASISLLVGGIGIMNIMLVSVTERTREIGIRMAVGAKKRDILWQFLVEAMMLSFIGGLVGIGLGVSGSKLISSLAAWPSLLSWDAIALAFVFSGAVGVFFGFYPARKAAQLDPIQALRYE